MTDASELVGNLSTDFVTLLPGSYLLGLLCGKVFKAGNIASTRASVSGVFTSNPAAAISALKLSGARLEAYVRAATERLRVLKHLGLFLCALWIDVGKM